MTAADSVSPLIVGRTGDYCDAWSVTAWCWRGQDDVSDTVME